MSDVIRKGDVRENCLKLRKALSDEEVRVKSEEIFGRLKNLDILNRAATVHSYLSIPERHEVDTNDAINWLRESGKKVVVPRMKPETIEMSHVLLEEADSLVINRWGVPEPVGGVEMSIGRLDVVLVPMVGGDRQKNRLGYGMGYYDRFLADVKGVKIGLLFDRCLLNIELPVEEYDIAMDLIVTENEIF